ncbi:solute carrier family 41 member 2 isoform X3 [Takifugu flavidus]|nr:solute carrier family 41 member 2 isoform X3 [Takifugu flavidus]
MLSLLACVLSTVFGWTTEGKMAFKHVVILCSACISSSFLASLIQGVIMVGFVFGSKRFGFNPDNMATPMAASFGDLLTLALLAGCSFFSYSNIDSYPSVLYLVALFCLCLVPLWVVIASKHPASQALLHTGWTPIIIALVISSIGGVILERTVSDPNLAGIIVYAPIINAKCHIKKNEISPSSWRASQKLRRVKSKKFILKTEMRYNREKRIGGNLVSIQSSRISTGLHLNYLPGEVPADRRKCYNPCSIFFGSGLNHRSAQILLLLVIPGQLIFLYSSHLMKGAKTMPSFLLTAAFLAASVIQVFSLLCVADCMVHCLWRRGKDPDSYSIPYLTALGDLLGTALLSLVFLILWWVGDHGSL